MNSLDISQTEHIQRKLKCLQFDIFEMRRKLFDAYPPYMGTTVTYYVDKFGNWLEYRGKQERHYAPLVDIIKYETNNIIKHYNEHVFPSNYQIKL